jgi:hypothetical protein
VLELTCLRKGHLEEHERIEVVNTFHVEAYEPQLCKQEEERAAAEQHANGAQGERPPRQPPL